MTPRESDNYHCGVTVDLPTNDTICTNGTGLWKCWIIYDNYEAGAIVNILDPKSNNSTPEIIAKDVNVARGDDFMVHFDFNL